MISGHQLFHSDPVADFKVARFFLIQLIQSQNVIIFDAILFGNLPGIVAAFDHMIDNFGRFGLFRLDLFRFRLWLFFRFVFFCQRDYIALNFSSPAL